jgi:hypothetical protein
VIMLHNGEGGLPNRIVLLMIQQVIILHTNGESTSNGRRNRVVEEWVSLLKIGKILLAEFTCVNLLPPIVVSVFIVAYSTNSEPIQVGRQALCQIA